MNCSNSSDRPSHPIAHPTPSISVILADGSRMRVTDRDLAAQLRQERSATLTRLRQTRIEAVAAVAAKVSEDRIRREFEAREREIDATLRRLWKRVRIKVERTRKPPAVKKDRPVPIRPSRSIYIRTPSALARRDAQGREGIMLRIRYVRAGGKHASPGCLRRHWHYIAREAAVTLDSEGRPILLSNLGDTIEEIGDGLVVQEQVLRAMRKNAKLGFRMIGAFPYGFSPDARREALERIGEALFGARGLPWTAAAHDADPEAVADNPHFHLDYGLMPMERQADGSYLVANELRTDLDGPEGLRFVRHMMAQILTEVAQEQGLDRTFTALSYRDRGMDREGGEHVGQEATAAGRQGEHVAAIARNEARRRRDDALERAREARKRLDALEQLKRAIEREAADVPGIPDVPSFEAEAIPIPARQLVDGPHLTDSAMAVPPPAMPISDLALVDLPADSPPGIGQLPSGLVHLPDPAIAMLPTPELSVIPHVARSGVAPPTVTSIGPEAPGIPNVPSLAAIGHAGPIVLPAPSLAAIVEAAPEGLMPPVLADIGEADAMSMPAPPRMAAMGKLPPTIPAQHFQLWDIGREVARDEDDDRVEAELRRAVEREALRRREVAAAKPLNPFGDHAGNRVDPEFAQLLALIEKEPGLLTVHEGQVFPGDALPAHLRRALHGYALHPRARATLVNAARNARHSVSGNALARPSSPTAVRVASAQAARDTWER